VTRQKAKAWPADYWQARLDELRSDFEIAVWHAIGGNERNWSPEVNAVELFEEHAEAREWLRPKIADWCELHQFLAHYRLALDERSRDSRSRQSLGQ